MSMNSELNIIRGHLDESEKCAVPSMKLDELQKAQAVLNLMVNNLQASHQPSLTK